MKKLAVIFSIVLLASCSKKLLEPTEADANRVASEFPGITVAQLQEGRALFKHKCTQCHPAKNPASRDEAKWKQIIPQMAARAQKKGKEEISPADQDKILKYLVAARMAKK